MVKAIASGASALLGFFLSPVIGSLSDVYGRKPFLIFSEALNTLQLAGFLLFAFGYLSIWPYMVAQSVQVSPLLPDHPPCSIAMTCACWPPLQTAFSSLSVGMAYIADGVSPQNRSAAFGMVLAVFSLGIIIGPLLGGFLPQNAALYLAGVLGVSATLYAVFLLPESLPTELRKPYTPQRTSPIQGIKILFTTSLFRRLSLCVLFQTACGNGIQDVLSASLTATVAMTRGAHHAYGCRADVGRSFLPAGSVQLWPKGTLVCGLLARGCAVTALWCSSAALVFMSLCRTFPRRLCCSDSVASSCKAC